MKKTWIFFKLRMLQLKSDKTALFFCYVLPVLLLLGIGYPLQIEGDPKITLHYVDEVGVAEGQAFVGALAKNPLVELVKYEQSADSAYAALAANEIKRLLHILPFEQKPKFNTEAVEIETATQQAQETQRNLSLYLSKNNIDENRIENRAMGSIIDDTLSGKEGSQIEQYTLTSDRFTSYLVTLLPGLIGMTLMIIGLNGFGGVLIEEEHRGLFKNLKTIDISPIPFLSGLFLSRLLISYTVAIALCVISVLVFDISFAFNFILLALIVTMGSVAFLGIGLLIAAISPSTTSFNGIVNFVQLPFIILGGVFISISKFPEWVQYISMLIPLTQLNAAMQKVLFESMSLANIGDLSIELSILAAWSVISLVVAKQKFNW
jgi:ABC-2 type transport system permease protein